MRMRPGTLFAERGGLAIELVFVLPLYGLLWLGGTHAFTLYFGVVRNGAVVRACAWDYALDGCTNPPRGCELRGPTPQAPLRGAIRDRLADVGRDFGVLPRESTGPFGYSLGVTRTEALSAPVGLPFGEVTTAARYRALCGPKPAPQWTVEAMFPDACRRLGRFCP
jgi:hypothetical protein